MSFLPSSRERGSIVLTLATGMVADSHIGILAWMIISAGLAVREFVSIPSGSRSAAKTTTAETVKVSKEGRVFPVVEVKMLNKFGLERSQGN